MRLGSGAGCLPALSFRAAGNGSLKTPWFQGGSPCCVTLGLSSAVCAGRFARRMHGLGGLVCRHFLKLIKKAISEEADLCFNQLTSFGYVCIPPTQWFGIVAHTEEQDPFYDSIDCMAVMLPYGKTCNQASFGDLAVLRMETQVHLLVHFATTEVQATPKSSAQTFQIGFTLAVPAKLCSQRLSPLNDPSSE